ncbi:uncharacterized protein LOC116843348 [Odontomachus brunneus]|uniref:uncharacterized protein LOC116843348 n=1 Tax=Odontomachus brunneus TaxID=486640 RepID=UPI0013F1FF92|nr:uncharacterized protein LOC116843348 [Odontomachus brunneus]
MFIFTIYVTEFAKQPEIFTKKNIQKIKNWKLQIYLCSINNSYKGKVEIIDAREDTKQTDDEASARDGDRILARETIATIATAEKSKRDLMSVKPVAEQLRVNTLVTLQEEETREENIAGHESLIDKEKIEKGETSIKEEEYNDSLVERSKGGGGEEGIRMWQQFMCITEQGNMAKIKQSPRPSVSTQMSTTQIISPTRRVSRTSKTFPHLKLNKVDPIGNINIFDENRISGRPRHETSETAHVNRVKRDGFAELSSLVERQDACSFCEQQKSFTPISSNRYYSVYMDKKRYLCELCAPLYCKKVMTKIQFTRICLYVEKNRNYSGIKK